MCITVPFEEHPASFKSVLNQCSVDGLGGPVAIVVVGVADGIRPVRSARKLPSLLPGKAVSVVVARGIAYGVISDGAAVVSSKLILPVTVTIGIGIRACSCSGDRRSHLIGVDCCTRQVPAKVIAVDDRLIQVQVVLPDQLI